MSSHSPQTDAFCYSTSCVGHPAWWNGPLQQFQITVKCWCLQGFDYCKQSELASCRSFPKVWYRIANFVWWLLSSISCSQNILQATSSRPSRQGWEGTQPTSTGRSVWHWLIRGQSVLLLKLLCICLMWMIGSYISGGTF